MCQKGKLLKLRGRLLSLTLCSLLIISMGVVPSLAYSNNESVFKDLNGHWAEKVITEKYHQKLIKGYPDGTFRPEEKLTEAELISLINRYYGLNKKVEKNALGTRGNEWYADEARKAEFYGYFPESKIEGNKPATRMSMIDMMASLMGIEGEENKKHAFTDMINLNKEQKAIVNEFKKLGYLEGYGDGSFRGNKTITRAESIEFTDAVLGYIIRTQDDVKKIPKGKRITVIRNDIVLDDIEVDSIYISPGVTSEVEIKDTKVKNDILVGSIEAEIKLADTEVKEIKTNSKADKTTISLEGKTKVERILIDSDVELDGNGIEVENLMVLGGEPKLKDIEVKDELEIKGKSKVTLEDVKVDELKVNAKTEIKTDKDSKIETLVANEEVEISGKAKIDRAEIRAENVKLEEKPNYVKVDNDVDEAEIDGKDVDSDNDDYGSTSSGRGSSSRSGSSGNSSTDTTKPVITLNGESIVEINVGGNYIDAGVTVTDNVDNNLIATSVITLNGSEVPRVDVNVVGDYVITFSVVDSAGNKADDVVINVSIVEPRTIQEVITSEVINVNQGKVYDDIIKPTKVRLILDDNKELEVSISWDYASGNYEPNTPGIYNFTGTLDLPNWVTNNDPTNIKPNLPIKVNEVVTDTEAPVITLVGSPSIVIDQNLSYTDQGVTITDNVDSNLTATVTYTKDNASVASIDISVSGTYKVHYNVTDSAGNGATEVTRTVEVVSSLTVVSVESLTTFNVSYGTLENEVIIPTQVNATLSDNSTRLIDVTWAPTTTYDPNSAGVQKFTGTLTNLPNGVTNPNNVKATVGVNVQPQVKNIASVESLANKDVPYGTLETILNLSFPSSVTVNLEDNSTTTVDVNWTPTTSYDPNTSGTYKFAGTLVSLPSHITNNTNIYASITVNVQPKLKEIVSVEAIPDVEVAYNTPQSSLNLPVKVTVVFEDGTKDTYDVSWQPKNEYIAGIAGTYEFTGTIINIPQGSANSTGVTASINVIVKVKKGGFF